MRAVLEIRRENASTSVQSRQRYEEIYRGYGIRHIDSMYQWLLELLEVEPGRRLLDVACGVGVLPGLAVQMGVQAYGVDFAEGALRAARNEFPGVRVAVADGERLPFPDESFDYVTSIGSLEHYQHPACGAQELARVLKRGGRACVLLPNTFGILGNVWTALRTGRTFDDGQPIQRYAARLEWQELLEMGGLNVIRTVKYEAARPRTWADMRWYLGHPKGLIRVLLTPFIPLNWANYFVYLCSRL